MGRSMYQELLEEARLIRDRFNTCESPAERGRLQIRYKEISAALPEAKRTHDDEVERRRVAHEEEAGRARKTREEEEVVRSQSERAKETAEAESAEGSTSTPPSVKQCPSCAELIKLEAKKCRYCGELQKFATAGQARVEAYKARPREELVEHLRRYYARLNSPPPLDPEDKKKLESVIEDLRAALLPAQPSEANKELTRKCPHCKEIIAHNSTKCKYCGEDNVAPVAKWGCGLILSAVAIPSLYISFIGPVSSTDVIIFTLVFIFIAFATFPMSTFHKD